MMFILIVMWPAVFAGGVWLGYTVAIRQERERTADVLERIEPPSRTPGQPTNLDAEPARVTEPKRRPGHFMS